MHRFDYERIEKILWDDFEAKRNAKNAALEKFNAMMEEIPSHLLQPDGTQRVKNASRDYTAIRQKLNIAMERLNGFRDRGIVPDDLREKTPQSEDRGEEPRRGSGEPYRSGIKV